MKLLHSLSKREQRKFDRWLTSELSPKQVSVRLLFDQVKSGKYIEQIWSRLFPDIKVPEKPLLDSGFRRLENHLSEYLEEFIAIETFRKDTTKRDLYLLRGLNDRQVPDLFQAELRKVRKRLEKQPVRDALYHRTRFEILREEKAHEIRHQKSSSVASDYYRQFQLFWLHERLRMILVNLSEAGLGRMAPPKEETESLLAEVEGMLTQTDCPLLSIYRHILLIQSGEEKFSELITLLVQCGHMAGLAEQKNIFILLSNHLIRIYNRTKDLSKAEQLFYLFLWGIKEELIYFGGYLPPKTYRNIISIGLHIGNYDEVYRLIHELIERVPIPEREEAFRFNLGTYYFALGRIRETYLMFMEKFHSSTYEVAARTKILSLRYENGERTELESPLRSLKLFVKSQKNLSESFRESALRQILLLEKLVKLQPSDKFERLYTLMNRYESSVSERDLKNQIKELNPRLALQF